MWGKPNVGARETKQDPTGLILEQREFYYGFVEEVKTSMVDELRFYFRDNPRTTEFRWVGRALTEGKIETDPERTKVHVAVEFADNVQKYPSVLVGGVQARIRDLWFNNPTHSFYIDNPDYSATAKAAAEAAGQDYNIPERLQVGERLTGRLDFTVTLNVRALSEAELDRLSDLVLHGLIGQVRYNLQRAGMIWLPDQGSTTGTQTESLSQRQVVHQRSISFGLRTEWFDDFYYQAVNIAAVRIVEMQRA